MAYFLQQVLNGVHSAALYALLAYGYALSYGVTRRASFAHGALFALAGQLLILAAVFGYRQLWLTMPVAVLVGVAFGLGVVLLFADVLARRIYAPLAKASPNAFLAATLGVMIVFIELGRIAADTRDWWLPPLLPFPVVFARSSDFVVSLTVVQLVGVGVALLSLIAAETVIRRTRAGRIWRAACDDPLASGLCGVDPGRTLRITVAAATTLAAVAGILAALHYGNMSFEAGLTYGLKVIFIAALGAGGAPLAAALGGATVGFAEALWTAWFPAEWRDAFVLGSLCLLLILRPR